MRLFLALLTLLLVFISSAQAARNVETIVIFRHGEKPTLDFGQLKCKGLNRSMLLPQLLLQKFGRPDYIFAPYPYWKGFYYYVRAFVTIEPTAILLNMPVYTPHYYNEIERTAELLLHPQYHNSLLFVTWEHKNITRMTRKMMSVLGQNPNSIPTWSSSDFDSLYIFTIDWNTHPATVSFVHDHQNLNYVSDQCLPRIHHDMTTKHARDKRFLFVPAAEASLTVHDQLTCQGLNRALKLPEFLQKIAPKISLFVLPAPGEIVSKPQFKRALMTLEPTIIKRGGNYIPAGHDDIALLKKNKKGSFGVTLIAWPLQDIRHVMQTLYKSYGGDTKDIPPISNRNAVYEITVYDKKPRFRQMLDIMNTPSTECQLS